MNKNVLRLKKAVHSFLKELKSDPYKPPYAGNRYLCPVCSTQLAYFKPCDEDYIELLDKYEYIYPLCQDETFNRAKYSCPKCNANDRDRLYAMYFLKKLPATEKSRQLNIIDFAPAPGLSAFFRSFPFLNYRTADLYMETVDDNVDITDMKIYKDDFFDIFVCSHVLEHVDDDKKAMKELFRILKPGGWGIAMAPIIRNLERIVEDPAIVSEADRWKYYGQGDHMRLYNQSGFVERLRNAGFKVNLYDINYFGADNFEKHGIHPRSVLYIVEKL